MRLSIVKQSAAALLLGMAFTTLTVSAASAAEATSNTPIPATSAEIWQAIDSHVQALNAAVTKGELASVHHDAFAVRDLVRGLPTHSPGLSEAALTKVKEQSKFVDTLAARLDQTGDANDKAGTKANLSKLEGMLKTIRDQYASAK
jgi:hypothetical protein